MTAADYGYGRSAPLPILITHAISAVVDREVTCQCGKSHVCSDEVINLSIEGSIALTECLRMFPVGEIRKILRAEKDRLTAVGQGNYRRECATVYVLRANDVPFDRIASMLGRSVEYVKSLDKRVDKEIRKEWETVNPPLRRRSR